MKRLLIVGLVATSVVLGIASTASADPLNDKASIYSVTCTNLGSVQASAVFFASDSAPNPGTTSAFHVIDSNTVIIVFTGGVTQHPNDSCLFVWTGGDPPPPGWEVIGTDVVVVNG